MPREKRQLETIHEDSSRPTSEAPSPVPRSQQLALGTCAASAAFPYITLPDHCIRLVRILPESSPDDVRCTLEICSDYFTDDAHYTALSYCWGDPSVTKVITLDGRPVAVTTNLYHALVAIHQHHASLGQGRYWIDALCINQADGKERNHQVHQMWRIFSSANEVLAWVGPEDGEQSASCFEAIRSVASSCTYKVGLCPGWKKCHSALAHIPAQLINRLLQRSYFERTWVIQEFVQARKLWLICGRYSIAGDELYHLQKLCAGTQAGELLAHRWANGPCSRDRVLKKGLNEAVALLANTLFSYCRSICTDVRDKIFALLGDPVMRMLDPSMALKPDYTLDVESVAVAFVRHCDAIILAYAGGKPRAELDKGDIASHLNRFLYSLGQAFGVASRADFVERIKSQLQGAVAKERASGGYVEASKIEAVHHMSGIIVDHVIEKQLQPPRIPRLTVIKEVLRGQPRDEEGEGDWLSGVQKFPFREHRGPSPLGPATEKHGSIRTTAKSMSECASVSTRITHIANSINKVHARMDPPGAATRFLCMECLHAFKGFHQLDCHLWPSHFNDSRHQSNRKRHSCTACRQVCPSLIDLYLHKPQCAVSPFPVEGDFWCGEIDQETGLPCNIRWMSVEQNEAHNMTNHKAKGELLRCPWCTIWTTTKIGDLEQHIQVAHTIAHDSDLAKSERWDVTHRSPARVFPDRHRWYRRNALGDVCGPFTGQQMHTYYDAGWFAMLNLSQGFTFKRAGDSSYLNIEELIDVTGDSEEPFLVA